MPNTLQKPERLRSKKLFDQLFADGQSLANYPVRLVWTEAQLPEEGVPVQVAFSVPKRRFKRAVDRNRIKRQLREVYRTNKSELYSVLRSRQKTIALAVLFTGKEGPEFVELEKQLILTLTRLKRRYEAID